MSCKRFQKVLFWLSTLTHPAVIYKFIPFGEHFQKALFSVTENAVLVWMKGLCGLKSCIFKFIQLSVDVAKGIQGSGSIFFFVIHINRGWECQL